jgi:hypothetical protein
VKSLSRILKNETDSWYYFGNLKEAKILCILLTLIRSTQLKGLIPRGYLHEVFTKSSERTEPS